eukprot:TRINITY_DN8609_c1_g1_i3.p1 TRINITY_DN8609_c1_g1~~TRINITY_DN8609_c1_g1_i3.p1  ORF type:complete len:259 (+),score=40.41 TRINITY_DN8609_c1_g1_i3:191-967(+)
MSLRDRLVLKERLFLERQKRFNCAIHATNNLLQEAAYDQASFDAICEDLPQFGRWSSPYKSSVPYMGYYDASVVVTALYQRGLELQQHDARHAFPTSCLLAQDFYGLVLNIRSKSKAAFMLRLFRLAQGRHWLCVVPLRTPDATAVGTSASPIATETHMEATASATAFVESPEAAADDAELDDNDLQPVQSHAAASEKLDDDGWKCMQFAWLDSVRSKPTIICGEELLERLRELMANDGSVYVARPAQDDSCTTEPAS